MERMENLMIPEILKTSKIIENNKISKCWKCDLEGDGTSIIGEKYVYVTPSKNIIAYDSGGIFGTEILFKQNGNQKKQIFAYQNVGDTNFTCVAKFDNATAKIKIEELKWTPCQDRFSLFLSYILIDRF
jgi:hypothetical protein